MRRTLLLAMFTLPGIAWPQNFPPSGNVALPLEEYNRLMEQAGKPVKKSEAPPVAYALKSAVLKLQAGSDSVSGTIDVEGEVLAKVDTAVPLVSDMTIFDAQRQGKDLPVEQAASSTNAVLGPGEFSVTLRAGLPLKIEAGRAAFNLPVPAAGAVQLTLVIPGDRTNVYISPGQITSRTSSGGQTTIEATLAPGRTASIWWAAREAAEPVVPREVRFLSDIKTLVSVSEAAIDLVALVDITVVQGDPARFEVEIPTGYGITGVTGPSMDSSDSQPGILTIKVANAAVRSHQFLISLEKSVDTALKAEIPFVGLKGSQRETGEVLVEGSGSLELAAKESGALKRMDLKETSPYLRTLAHDSLTAAFRYHRQPTEAPGLALEWVRFPDSALPSAIAQAATVTTLVTSEGRSLTEVKLLVKNQSQPFLKVALPAGTSILSAEVAGEKVKPAEGPDGQRVPLLRSGFRPTGEYTVSFVFLHAGAPFAKKGGSELALPKMDMPVGLVNWEVFLPAQYKVADFGGNVIPESLVALAGPDMAAGEVEPEIGRLAAAPRQFLPPAIVTASTAPDARSLSLAPGMVGGLVVDPSGAAIPGAHLTVADVGTGFTRTTDSDPGGRWFVSGFSPGRLRVTADKQGFQRFLRMEDYTVDQPLRVDIMLNVGSTADTVVVTAAAPLAMTMSASVANKKVAPMPPPPPAGPSSAVLDLKQKVSGVLPIAIDVPRTGTSYRFVKPLVIDEETTVTFAYRTK